VTSAADKIEGRQREILERLARGDKRDTIASDLKIARGTLDTYVSRLYIRLDAHTPAQALNNFIRLQHPKLALF
jgi:DNA-binding NarL/FixJ family response regulator